MSSLFLICAALSLSAAEDCPGPLAPGPATVIAVHDFSPVPLHPAGADADPDTALLAEMAQDEARARLGRPVDLHLEWLSRAEDWAFILAELRAPGGAAFDFAGTPLEAAARAGGASAVFCALFRRDGAGWAAVEVCLGPGDMVWDGWDRLHGAPASLFRPPEAVGKGA